MQGIWFGKIDKNRSTSEVMGKSLIALPTIGERRNVNIILEWAFVTYCKIFSFLPLFFFSSSSSSSLFGKLTSTNSSFYIFCSDLSGIFFLYEYIHFILFES